MQNDNTCQMDQFLRSKFETTPLPVSTQEPSAVPPTHESCDESEDDEWKYMKEGQGEKQLLGLQSDTVVEEELQQQLQEAAAFTVHSAEKLQQSEPTFNEPIVAAVDLDSIKNTFDTLTQNISDLAESAAEVSESAVEQIGDTLESINISQSSTQEKLDNLEDEDLLSEMNSKLNPEAKEFVPTFSSPGPTDMSNGLSGAPPSAIPQHFKDEVLAQSPRKGRESDMEDIKIPAENEFDLEIAHKPHGLPGDEAIIEQAENGGQYQEMNWKEAMHGSEKEEEPMVDSPVTEESLEVVDNAHQYDATTHPICDFSAPVDLDNAGMKESIYIENNTSAQSNEEDVLNTVQLLPEEENDSKDNSFEVLCKEEVTGSAVEEAQIKDAVTMEEVQEILNLEIEKKLEEMNDVEIQQKMEQLLLSHDQEITKDIQLETEQVPINGVEMSPTTPEVALIPTEVAVEPVVEQPQEPSAPVELSTSPVPVADEAIDALTIGAAAAVAVAATTAAVKKVEAEKNQKNLSKTSSATKSKVPDTKKPAAGTTTKSSTVSSVAAKRPLSDKPKPATASSLATKKTVGSTTSAAPRPRPAPASGATKMVTEKKTTTTTTTSTAKSRIDTRPPLTARKPLTSSAVKTSLSKPTDDAKSGSTTLKSSVSKSTVGSKPSVGSTRPTSAISKPRPTTASSVATTNGTGATKTPASKPTPLAPKSATNLKASMTSPRGTLTSSLRKTEAIKSPTKTTSTTITSRVSTTNGTKPTTTTRTTTTKTTSSTVQPAAARSTTTTTTTTRRPLAVGGTTSTGGPTTPTPKTNNLVPRKSTPLKKTTSTPPVRKSLGSKLNASATKPTKDTTTPRPVTIPSHITNNHSAAAAAAAAAASTEALKDIATLEPTPLVDGEPKLNGITSPDDVPSPIAPAASHPLEMEIA